MSLIYLDNSATSFPKAPGVAEAVKDNLLTCGTSGRASYDEALKGSRVLYSCRNNLAALLGAGDSSRIILNSGTTESLNTVLKGFLKEGMKALTSSSEHNSVMRPLHSLARERRVAVNRFRNMPDGQPDLDDYRKKLADRPDLVILCHSSNVSGVLSPVAEMIELAHRSGALVCLDGAQSAGHEKIDLQRLEADFFCFSGHKGLLGPAGTGGFFIREGLEISPLLEGGTGSLSGEEYQPGFLPDRYESGTRNIPGFAGLAASASYILEKGIEEIIAKEKELRSRLTEGLKSIEGIVLTGPDDGRMRNSVISFFHDTMDLSDLAEELDGAGIAMRMGLHCSPSAHKTMGTYDRGGTIRFSPGFFNSPEEMDRTIEILRSIANGR